MLLENEFEGTTATLCKKNITLEIGPIFQGQALYKNFFQTKHAINSIVESIDQQNEQRELPPASSLTYYQRLPIHVDYTRDQNDFPNVLIHPDFYGKDYQPLSLETPIFITLNGETIYLKDKNYFSSELISLVQSHSNICPIFIGESAYVEKKIAFVLVQKLFF